MSIGTFARASGVAMALGLLAASAGAAPPVAGIYVPVGGCSPEVLDVLSDIGLDTLFVASSTCESPEVERIARLASARGLKVMWTVYYDGGPEIERGFEGNPRRFVPADGRRTQRTPCPLDPVYWERAAGERAVKLAGLSGASAALEGIAFDVELYAADAGWSGPCYCDDCWSEFWAKRGKPRPATPADGRAEWLAARRMAQAYARFEHGRVAEICAGIRRSAQRISPRFRFGVLPYQDFFGDDLVRGFGTSELPMYSMNEFTYGERGLSPKELGIMMGLVERGLPCVSLAGLWAAQQSPALTRTFAYQAGQIFDGYWLYGGLPWSQVFIERSPTETREEKITGSPAEWRQAIREANRAMACARGAGPFRSGWQPPSSLGYWTQDYWAPPGAAPTRKTGPGGTPVIPTGMVMEVGIPLAGEASFRPEALLPGRCRVSAYVRQEGAPALTLRIGGQAVRQAASARVGPEVWRVDFGERQVESPNERWTLGGGAPGARWLYLACGAVFPREWSVAGPYDDPTGDLGAEFPPDGPGFHAWKAVRADETGLVDLAWLFGKRSNALAYAAIDAWSPEEQDAFLLVGSDDGVRVLLNGRVVHEHPCCRHASPDEDVAPVRLRAGWNRILAKVQNVGDDWGLYLRVYAGGRPVRYRPAR